MGPSNWLEGVWRPSSGALNISMGALLGDTVTATPPVPVCRFLTLCLVASAVVHVTHFRSIQPLIVFCMMWPIEQCRVIAIVSSEEDQKSAVGNGQRRQCLKKCSERSAFGT
eukprot:7669057-Karenia_brevis.AAC.1